MQKLFQDKRAVLFLVVFALLALMLLASSLRNLDLLPSQGFGIGASDTAAMNTVDVKAVFQEIVNIPLWKQLIFWGVLFLLILLIGSLLSPELRKRLIRIFIRVALSAIGLFYLLKLKPDLLSGIFGRFDLMGGLSSLQPGADLPEPVFEPPQDTNWLSFVVGLAVVVLVILFVWWVSRIWSQIFESNAADIPLNEIAGIARESLGNLRAGRNYENSIIECYDRMGKVIADRRGLHRAYSMTSSEFANRLIRSGLPRDPVETLTHLFEVARYGNRPAGQGEIDQAVACLSAIITYFGEAA